MASKFKSTFEKGNKFSSVDEKKNPYKLSKYPLSSQKRTTYHILNLNGQKVWPFFRPNLLTKNDDL